MVTKSDEQKETFFPNVRKKVLLEHVAPLANAESFRRIKLTLSMPLNDGQVLGIPDWLDDPIKLVQRVNSGSKEWKGTAVLDGVNLTFFPIDTAKAADIKIIATVMDKFLVRRSTQETPKGDVADTELVFVAYTDYRDEVWSWAFAQFNRHCFVQFGTTQATLSFGKPAKDDDCGDEEDGEDPAETERKAATSKSQDELFDPKKVAEMPAAGKGKKK